MLFEVIYWLPPVLLAIAAGTSGGVVGFGSTVILLPFRVLVFGPTQAVPILTITGLERKLSRVAFSPD